MSSLSTNNNQNNINYSQSVNNQPVSNPKPLTSIQSDQTIQEKTTDSVQNLFDFLNMTQNSQGAMHDRASNIDSHSPEGTRTLFAATSQNIVHKPTISSKYDEVSRAKIDTVIKNDQANLARASEFFKTPEISLTRNNPALTTGCKALINANEQLFTNEEEFSKTWDAFLQTQTDLGVDTTKVTRNLNGKGYHNIGHAKEMFYDAYEALAEQGFPASTCMAGATMAFFHDLVQGYPSKPFGTPVGENEELTAKFMNYLIDQNPAIDSEPKGKSPKEALKMLSNATIVGGTFLVKVMRGNNPENRTICEFEPNQHGSDPAIVGMREILARNDVSRTLPKPKGWKPVENNDQEVQRNLAQIKQMKAQRNDQFKNIVSGSRIATDLLNKYPLDPTKANVVSRLFQSIRVIAEFSGDKKILVKDSDQEKAFIGKLKNTNGTWLKGDFSEETFATQSNHMEYVAMLNEEAVSFNEKYNDDDFRALTSVALLNGQDGSVLNEQDGRGMPLPGGMPNVSQFIGS
jgi:hypothetical protein